MPLNLNGQIKTVPGIYGTVEVIIVSGVTLPVFNVLLFVGGAKKGIPFNATGKKGYEVILPFSSLSDIKNYYGVGDISKAFAQGKNGNMGIAYCVNVASLTLANATLLDNTTDPGPVSACDIYPIDDYYGAVGNDISLTIATSNNLTTFTIVPPKLTKFLTADASLTNKVLSVPDVEG
ncbi:MAG: hypothetical protein P4L45_00725, partial [Ignavibacteriaceae bacterium]|nr:hypothetical protein [Ignavibacteriaceae bacterium]